MPAGCGSLLGLGHTARVQRELAELAGAVLTADHKQPPKVVLQTGLQSTLIIG